MRKTLALVLALLASCATHSTPEVSPKLASAAATPQDLRMETDESRARALVAQLARHDFAGATAGFDDKMRAAMPPDKLGATWAQIEQQAGTFQRVEGVDLKPGDGVVIVEARTSFAKAPLLLRIVYDPQHRVVGLFAAPAEARSDWQPPPYAAPDTFEEREVTVGSSPALPGTLTLPKHAHRVPAVVLVHGSGPNDRDETLGPLKPFKDLAWGLASRGIAVLRYEKRSRVAPMGMHTQKEEVDDGAHAAVALLRALRQVDPTRLALLGHSQGGNLAPRLAQADPAIRRLVIFAGSTRPLQDSLVAQMRYLKTLQPDERRLDEMLAKALAFKAAVESPSLKVDDAIPNPLGAVPIPGAYFLEVRDYHPERVAARLSIPILLLQGERDYQVTIADDYAAWKAALAGNPRATFHAYPGLNHFFTRGEGPPSPADYGRPGHVDAQVVTDIAAWLNAP